MRACYYDILIRLNLRIIKLLGSYMFKMTYKGFVVSLETRVFEDSNCVIVFDRLVTY